MAEPLILALDQGTTSTRAILFEANGKPVCDAGRGPNGKLSPRSHRRWTPSCSAGVLRNGLLLKGGHCRRILRHLLERSENLHRAGDHHLAGLCRCGPCPFPMKQRDTQDVFYASQSCAGAHEGHMAERGSARQGSCLCARHDEAHRRQVDPCYARVDDAMGVGTQRLPLRMGPGRQRKARHFSIPRC